MTNEAKRLDRINTIFKYIGLCNEKGLSCDKEKLILAYQLDHGLSRRIIQEYLKLLLAAKKIEDKGGELWIIK